MNFLSMFDSEGIVLNNDEIKICCCPSENFEHNEASKFIIKYRKIEDVQVIII